MKWSAPSKICNRPTMTFRYMRSMDSTSRTSCFPNTSATVCGSFDFGSACGAPLRLGDRLTVVPLMEVISHLPSHARKRSRRLLSEPEQAEAKTKMAGRAHGVLVGPREERDAREGNRRCPFLALLTVRFSQVRPIIYMLVGLRQSLAGVLSQKYV